MSAGLTLEKTWNRIDRVSTTSSSYSIKHRTLLWEIKDALVTGTGAWTVLGSCDGSTYGMDATDRWTDYTKIVFGSNISWIVLQQTGMGSSPNYGQLLIATTNDTSTYKTLYIQFSWNSAFSGGDLTTKPTASSYCTICNNDDAWLGAFYNGSATYKGCVYKTSDGSCTRVIIGINYTSSKLSSGWILDTLKNPVSWITKPYLVGINDNAAPFIRSSLYGSSATDKLMSYATGTGNIDCVLAIPGYRDNVGGYKPLCDQDIFLSAGLDGRYPVCPCGVRSLNVTSHGRIGDMYDFWAVPNTLSDALSLLDGNEDAHKVHVINDFALGDDGTTVSYY